MPWRGTIHPMLRARMTTPLILASSLAALVGCATRSDAVAPLVASPAEFAAWTCEHIEDELDRVQQRAADVAWTVDAHAGNNLMALGVGVTLFWPALLAMRPDGLEASELARLKGRDEALRTASRLQACPAAGADLPAARVRALPVALGERLVFEDRRGARKPAAEWALRLLALRRNEIEYTLGAADGTLRQDLAGNVVAAPPGTLLWPHLLRTGLDLGQVTGGDILIAGDPLARARMRGQVVAVGPQTVAGRRFDVAVVELFGDAVLGESATRVEGVIVIDRASGVLLRLDLRSADEGFSIQRRLIRVEPRP